MLPPVLLLCEAAVCYCCMLLSVVLLYLPGYSSKSDYCLTTSDDKIAMVLHGVQDKRKQQSVCNEGIMHVSKMLTFANSLLQ